MKIVFLATRVSGNDGVSLEAEHWRDILRKLGHKVTFVAGELDRSGVLIPELHFKWPDIVRLHDEVVYGKNHYRRVEREIFEIAGRIEGKLREIFNNSKKIDLLIVANVFSLPVHFPLAVALARVIEEYKIPTIARHHDFWWERERYRISSMFPFFKKWFPPLLPNISHVVINSIAQKELQRRFGIDSAIISDTFNFESNLNKLDAYSCHFRKDFGIGKDDLVFLQATRVVPRKRIELSIELIRKLNNPKAVLVIAGKEGDEAGDYGLKIRKLVEEEGVRAIFVGDYIDSRRAITASGRRIYTLWDAYVNCDFVTYPTKLEGFGNQFIEAVYFKKPIIMTPYPVFRRDIEPLGFKYLNMINKGVFKKIYEVDYLKNMVDKNFEIAKRNFSYEATAQKINKLLHQFFGL